MFFFQKHIDLLISLHYTDWMKQQYHNMYCHNCLSRELRSLLGINEQYCSTRLICKCMICNHWAKCLSRELKSLLGINEQLYYTTVQ